MKIKKPKKNSTFKIKKINVIQRNQKITSNINIHKKKKKRRKKMDSYNNFYLPSYVPSPEGPSLMGMNPPSRNASPSSY